MQPTHGVRNDTIFFTMVKIKQQIFKQQIFKQQIFKQTFLVVQK